MSPEHAVSTAVAEPRLTAVVAATTTWDEFPALWRRLLDRVYAFVRTRPDLAGAAAPGGDWQNVMLYCDDVPRVEVGVLVSKTFEPRDGVVPSSLPGGPVLTAVHRGDFRLGGAHAAVDAFAAEHGLGLAGSRWEVYGHWREDPSEVVTEVFWLLA